MSTCNNLWQLDSVPHYIVGIQIFSMACAIFTMYRHEKTQKWNCLTPLFCLWVLLVRLNVMGGKWLIFSGCSLHFGRPIARRYQKQQHGCSARSQLRSLESRWRCRCKRSTRLRWCLLPTPGWTAQRKHSWERFLNLFIKYHLILTSQ